MFLPDETPLSDVSKGLAFASKSSPRLKAILQGEQWRACETLSLYSVVEVANIWDSAEEAVEALVGAGLNASEASELFEKAEHICSSKVFAAARSRPAWPHQEEGTTAADQGEAKRLKSTSPLQIIAAVVPTTVSGQSTASARRMQGTLTELWDILIELGEASGVLKEAYTLTKELQEQLRRSILEQWADLPLSSLRAYVGAWKEWRQWARANNLDHIKPARIHLVLFCDDLKKRGATAARGRLAALAWIERHLEVQLGTNASWVRTSAAVHAEHEEKQIPPLRISMWVILCLLSESKNTVVQGLGLFWMLILGGVLRPCHLQRSRIIKLWPNSIQGKASAGKTKHGGKRRAFEWRAARQSLIGSDMGKAVMSFRRLTGADLHDLPFVLPDVAPFGAGLEAKSWTAEPMPQGKILALTMKALEAVGVPPETAAQLKGLYAARRVLPTLAHRMGFTEPERLDVGAWSNPNLAMPQRYSEAKLDQQADLRTELITVASCALRKLATSNPEPNQGDELEMCYTNVWPHFPKKRGKKMVTCDRQQAIQWCCSMFPRIDQFEKNHEEMPSKEVEFSSSSSESETSSDSSEDEQEKSLATAPTATEDPENIDWLLARGKKGCLHLATHAELPDTICGRSLKSPEHGSGLALALKTDRQWSPRCYAHLCADAKVWWKRASLVA